MPMSSNYHIYPDRIEISKSNQFFRKNLYDSCKKTSYPAVSKWIKSMCNHFCYVVPLVIEMEIFFQENGAIQFLMSKILIV